MQMIEYCVKANRLCRKHSASEHDVSILLLLNIKIYSIDIDYLLAAPTG